MDTDKVRELALAVDNAKKKLDEAKYKLNVVHCHNGQQGYTVSVNGINVAVSVMDSRTYMGSLIRGREMIHLGAIKAVSALVDYYQDSLNAAEKNLKNYIQGDV